MKNGGQGVLDLLEKLDDISLLYANGLVDEDLIMAVADFHFLAPFNNNNKEIKLYLEAGEKASGFMQYEYYYKFSKKQEEKFSRTICDKDCRGIKNKLDKIDRNCERNMAS